MTSLFRARKTFIARQIAPVTLLALLSCLSDYAASILSTIIVGGSLGEMGLVIVGVTTPIETFRLFVCDMFCGSTVYLRSVSISEGKREKGDRMVGGALALICVIGTLLFLGMYFGADFYLSFFSLEEETLVFARQYVKAMAINPLIAMLMYFSYEFVFRLGAKLPASVMVALSSMGVAIFGLFFTRAYGVVGMAYGCNLGEGLTFLVGAATILVHRKDFSFRLDFRKEEVTEVLRYGFSYSQDTFYYPVYSAAINMFLGRSLGESAIAVFAIIECVSEICSVFYGVSYAAENQLSYYIGEKNTDGMRKALSASLRLQFMIAAVVTVLVFIFARPIAVYMGMEAQYAKETILALRLYSLSFVFLAWLCYNSDFYCACEQTIACVSLYFSKTILAGVAITIGLGLAFGSTGVYVGKALEAPIALFVTWFVIRKVYKTGNIYVLPQDDGTIVSFDYDLTQKEVMDVHGKLHDLLGERQVPGDVKMRILLAFEECNMLTIENNRPGKYGECTLFFKGDAIEMILRDNGRQYDITNADNLPSSLRSYVISCMVLRYQNASHINASSTNRIALSFPLKRN